jgi:molybdate transport system ATP-binding protein
VERRGQAAGVPLAAWRRRIGWVSPELQGEYLERVTLLELVGSGLRASVGLDRPLATRQRQAARAALRRVGLRCDPGRDASQLSYGQRRLAFLARALVAAPEALLLDEPLTGLDAPTRARLLALLARLAAEGVQLVVAAHHAADLPAAVNRVLTLHAGSATAGPR